MARYIAVSAFLSSASASSPSAGNTRDADARAREDLDARRPRTARSNASRIFWRDGGRLARVVELGQEHDELVAAEAGDGVVGAGGAAEPLGHRLQEQVADGVAEAVVDVLEAVEVEEEDGAVPVGAPGVRDGHRGAVLESVRLASPVSSSWWARCSNMARPCTRRTR